MKNINESLESKLVRLSLVFLFIILSCNDALASSVITANALKTGVYASGQIYIALDRAIDQSGCSIPYIELPPNSLVANSILSIALTASTTGKTLTLKTDTCYNGSPSFSGSRDSFIIMN